MFRIRQTNAGCFLVRRHLADDCINSRVGAEAQNVQVAGRDETVASLRKTARRRQTPAETELEFREAIVYTRCRFILLCRFLPAAARFQIDAGLIDRFPFRQLLGGKIGSVHRGQRRAVSQICGDRGEYHSGACPPGDHAYIDQVSPIVLVDRRQAEIIGRNLVAQEHLHASPPR